MQKMWQIRQILALSMLAICAYTDIREKNIYVMPLVITGTGAVVISLVSMAQEAGGGALITLTEYIALPVLAGLAAICLSRVARGHIGEGDALLLGVLGLITGIRIDILSFTAGLVVIPVYAAVTLLLPKRRRISSIAFAPFVMTGYVLVLANEI